MSGDFETFHYILIGQFLMVLQQFSQKTWLFLVQHQKLHCDFLRFSNTRFFKIQASFPSKIPRKAHPPRKVHFKKIAFRFLGSLVIRNKSAISAIYTKTNFFPKVRLGLWITLLYSFNNSSRQKIALLSCKIPFSLFELKCQIRHITSGNQFYI